MKISKIVLLLCCCLISFSGASGILVSSPSYYSYNSDCPPEKPFNVSSKVDRECRSCDELEVLVLEKEHKADFDRCPNRETVGTGDLLRSRLKECPKSHPLRDHWGSCRSCEDPKAISLENKTDCDVCPNRQTEEWMKDRYRCSLKKCPADFPLFDNRDCLACDSPYVTYDDKETCEKCPNRQYMDPPARNLRKGCYLKPKDESRPLFCTGYYVVYDSGSSHNPQLFYPCDDKEDIWTVPEVCAKCPNRDYIDGKCVFRECPKGSMKGSYLDDDPERCWLCDESLSFKTTKEECHKCPDRLFGGSEGEERCRSCSRVIAMLSSEEECARCPDLTYDPETKLCKGEERTEEHTIIGIVINRD